MPIVCVETDEIDVIEDMFLRLNETVSLVAAETRNAIGGPMAKAIIEVSEHLFLTKKLELPTKGVSIEKSLHSCCFLNIR